MSAGYESRRRVYERLAQEFCGEFVAVKFERDLRSFSGNPCNGFARWSGYGHYEILIQTGLPPDLEAFICAHEAAHIRLKHPPQIAPTYIRNMIANTLAADASYHGPTPHQHNEDCADAVGQILVLSWRIAKQIDW